MRLSADGEELGALETMLGLGLSRMNTLRPAGINLVLRLVHRSLLGVLAGTERRWGEAVPASLP
ncbi:MAG: hypothetical protein ACLT2T_10570 [Bilophila wadsworthia]